jgi:hypothetical protein
VKHDEFFHCMIPNLRQHLLASGGRLYPGAVFQTRCALSHWCDAKRYQVCGEYFQGIVYSHGVVRIRQYVALNYKILNVHYSATSVPRQSEQINALMFSDYRIFRITEFKM